MAAYVAGDDYIYLSNSDNSDFDESFRTIRDDIFDHPSPPPSDLESEAESVNLNENDENGNEPNSYGLQETPIYNYSGDAENEENFHDGSYWAYLPNEEDTGPEIGPFPGKRQLLLDPHEKKLEYFFNEMFSLSMFDTIAESTNRYTTQKLQNRGMLFYYFFYVVLLFFLS